METSSGSDKPEQVSLGRLVSQESGVTLFQFAILVHKDTVSSATSEVGIRLSMSGFTDGIRF